MQPDSGNSKPLWADSGNLPAGTPLPAHQHLDVIIVGGGIAGISCGYMLSREGKRVAILDDGPLAGGETCRTTAHLSSVIDDRFTEVERIHGPEGSRLAYESHASAIDLIEKIVSDESIECGFLRVDAYLFQGDHPSGPALEKELEAARRAGFSDAEMVDPPLPTLGGKAIRFPRQAQFDPIKYLARLSKAITRLGGVLCTDCKVCSFDPREDGVTVHLEGGETLEARAVIVATNSPITSLTTHIRQAPYRTYAMAFEVPAGLVPSALYWDTEDPYHYIRLQHGNSAGNDTLIVGGEDHKTGKADDADARFTALIKWTQQHFPMVGEEQYRWSGQVMETADGLGHIGRTPGGEPHMFMSTGDSGMGMTHSTIAAILLTDLILGRPNPWETLYSPRRKSLRFLPTFLRENATAIPQLLKHILPGEVKSRDDIKPGEGAVIRHGLKKIATFRDESGAYHELSATCTHLGCTLEWNNLEKSWDCPCHGSRFNTDGKILNGPTEIELPRA